MCLVKTPKIKDDGSDKKPLPILRNPLLDGLAGSIQSIRLGRSSLRIDRILDGATGGSGVGGGVSAASTSSGSSSSTSSSSSGSSGGGARRDISPRVNLV